MRVYGVGYTLIALAVVIGTYVEYGVVFAVIPAYEHILFLYKREETIFFALHLLTALHLCQEP